MSADERAAELRDRVVQNRTNAVIARNQALDIAKRMERDISDLRRKLDHDDVEDLADGIGYQPVLNSDAFALERFLVRITHFLGEMKVAKYDLEELQKEAALVKLADRPRGRPHIPATLGEPVPAGGKAIMVTRINPEPYIEHPFIPQEGAWRYCAVEVEDQDKDLLPCGQAIEYHKELNPEYARCGLPKEAHSVNPSPVEESRNPHGHAFFGIEAEGREPWQNCQYPVKGEANSRPDPRSHRFQGGNGSKCTYSSYGVECQGTRRDHNLL